MLKTEQPPLEIELLADDTVTHMTTFLSLTEAHFFARGSKNLHHVSLPYKKDKAQLLKSLLQAVIDDHQDKVKDILDECPWLLLEKPTKNQTIRSEYTHQLFNLEVMTAVQVALLRNQLEMTKLILPYFEKIVFEGYLKTTGAKEALKQWEACEVIKEKKKERIKAYDSQMKLLIEDIAKGTFDIVDFRTGLLPKEKAIYLDEYVDIEALLLSAYQGYYEYFDTFKNWDQRNVFAIKVIGFLQSLVTPETAKVFCEGLYYVVEEGRKPGDVAKSLKLVNEPTVQFYRSAEVDSKGLGYEFLAGPAGRRGGRPSGGGADGFLYGKFCQSKTSEFCQLKSKLKAGYLPTFGPEPVTQNSCLLQ